MYFSGDTLQIHGVVALPAMRHNLGSVGEESVVFAVGLVQDCRLGKALKTQVDHRWAVSCGRDVNRRVEIKQTSRRTNKHRKRHIDKQKNEGTTIKKTSQRTYNEDRSYRETDKRTNNKAFTKALVKCS